MGRFGVGWVSNVAVLTHVGGVVVQRAVWGGSSFGPSVASGAQVSTGCNARRVQCTAMRMVKDGRREGHCECEEVGFEEWGRAGQLLQSRQRSGTRG